MTAKRSKQSPTLEAANLTLQQLREELKIVRAQRDEYKRVLSRTLELVEAGQPMRAVAEGKKAMKDGGK